ncbi:CHAT domain-containing protein [Roseofilum capinflatum]|uniref:Tetratricopeptide repeat protein n=1 Tax=Roseofilum capinflatum BLCC-M114 TaxID=3022440 RepID=A0ABT7BD54_9CYAN|nr:CHAT domain-containing protein [Roseofilum capinflatum]MDJ1177119.1 tetratricopeptide repeat protein [Roseofilum capinflatum BLCC-M114]
MDEQRIAQYAELIQKLLACPNGEELEILEANVELLDAGLLAVMAAYSQYLRSQGEENNAKWLEEFAQHLEPAIREMGGSDNAESWETVNQQIVQLYQQGQYAAAIPLGERAIELARERWGNEHENVATSLNNLAELYKSQGRYSDAEPLYQEALAIIRIALPENHPNLATHLNNLAGLYRSQGRYTEAEPLFQEALAIDRIALPENHPDLATHLNNLAVLYRSQGRYTEAEPLFQEALAIDRIALPENHPDLATHLNNLAVLYRSQGRYTEAEPLFQEALAIDRIALPEHHPNLATHLNNLAGLYRSQGRYTEAEPLYQEALAIARLALPENHPSLATSLNNLALLYQSQGRYTDAEPLYQEAIAIDRIALPENHPSLATHLNNLAGLYQSQGRYTEAEPLFQEALAIDRIALPEHHPNLATHLNNLAGLYRSQGRYTEAEPLYQEALAIDRIALPENHPDLATHLNNLAVLYRSQGRYTEAEPLFQEALAIDRIALPEHHPDLATHLNNLALLYEAQGRYTEALEQFQASLECEQNRLRYIFSTHSDRERREYLQSNRDTYDLFLSLVSQYLADDPEAVGAALDAVLRRKSLTTAALAAQSAVIHGGRYGETVMALFRQWQDALEQLREATYSPPPPQIDPEVDRKQRQEHRQRVKELQTEAESLEKQLAKEVPELQLNQDTINRQGVADQLPEGSALVEFVLFQRYDFDGEKGKEWQEERYLAFTVMAHQPEQVRLIDLGEAEALDGLITQFRGYFTGSGDNLARHKPGFAEQQAQKQKQEQEQVYRVLCQPLIEALAGVSHWFLAPDGALNLLPFQILPMPSPPAPLPRARGVGDCFVPLRSTRNDVEEGSVMATEGKPSLSSPDTGDCFAPLRSARNDIEEESVMATEGKPSLSSPDTGDCFAPLRSTRNDGGEEGKPSQGYLANIYSMSYLSSGRDLLPRQLPKRKLNVCPATILADPDYDWDGVPFDSAQGTDAQGTDAPFDSAQGTQSELGGETLTTLSGFGRAVGTDIFGRQVAERLGTQAYLDKEAVSTHLTHSACPRILAIATHGFARTGQKPYVEFVLALLVANPEQETQLFEQHSDLMNPHLLEEVEQVIQYCQDNNYPEFTQRLRALTPNIQAYLNAHPPSRLDSEAAEDAMYRAGVALAGANIWNQGKPLPEGMKGVLLAQDIAALDLWGNELSALIACQTGLGEVASGEGVFGLRRAFVVAGSKTLIMSLWSVPALATAYLMERFFHHLEEGLGRAAALAHAQSDVCNVTAGELRQSDLGQSILQEQKRNYADEERPLSHPYYWGAWVCQGDIGQLSVAAMTSV